MFPDLESFFTVNQQARLFLISCLFGIPLGILFDIFRALRAVIPHNTLLVAIEDIICMAVYAVFMTAFTIVAARGDYRFFYTIGNLLGFMIYFFTAGNVVIGVIRKISGWLRRLFEIMLYPFRKLYGKIVHKCLRLSVKNDDLKKNPKSS